MKLKEVKKWINKLSDEELKGDFVYNSERLFISGTVEKITKAKTNLYYTGEDDPVRIYTKNELLEEGYEKEDIEGMTVEIPKGAYFIEF
jgi:hypothetical protein